MKRSLFLLLTVAFCIAFQGCLKDKLTKTYTVMIPVYKDKSEVYSEIISNAPRTLSNPGKMFVYGNYIFLNELDKGVHIIDNSNPSSPVQKAFINIPGNLDIAVKGNILYADLYNDMVVVDISNPLDARYVRHVPNIFPGRMYGNGFVGDTSRVIVDWIKKDTTIELGNEGRFFTDYFAIASFGGGGTGAGPVGVAGSMARFSVVNNHLYTVNHSELLSFDISNTTSPVKVNTRNVGWNIETIYPFGGKLFIGSNTGMFIYNISNPAAPEPQGQFTHVRACDPVVADNDYAYVTLRSGNNCNTATNELHIVNVSNVFNPVLTKSYALFNPHGLAKSGNTLFICDGKQGLKVFNVTDPLNIVLEQQLQGMETYDAIAFNNNLLIVAKDGLYQYDYSVPGTLAFRSKIPVTP